MSRATAVKKKPMAKAANAKKVATRTVAPKAHKPVKNNKPAAKMAKAAGPDPSVAPGDDLNGGDPIAAPETAGVAAGE